MAGYPYTGGIYGGYSDPANNKKKTFVGPKSVGEEISEAAIGTGKAFVPRVYRVNPDVGASTVSEAGSSSNPLARTPKGYPNIGLSTPPRETPLNIPFDNGMESQAPIRRPTAVAPPTLQNRPSNPLVDLKPAPSHDPSALPPAQMSQQQSRQPGQRVLPPGMNMQQGEDGSRTYTMGQQGQDGYGRMVVHGPAQMARNALAQLPAGYERRGDMTYDTNRGIYAQTVDGLSIASTDPDAVARFSAPITQGVPTPKRMVVLEPSSPDYQTLWNGDQNPLAQPPKYMTEEEGRQQGIGWKARRDKYRDDLAAYIALTGQANSINTTAMSEAGQMAREDLRSRAAQDANDISRQRMQGELGLAGINQQKGQMDIDALRQTQAARAEYLKNPTPENEAKYRAMIGKVEREPQYGTIGEYDDNGMKIGERLYNKQAGELRKNIENDPAMDIIKSNPAYQKAYESAPQKKQREMLRALRERLAQEGR